MAKSVRPFRVSAASSVALLISAAAAAGCASATGTIAPSDTIVLSGTVGAGPISVSTAGAVTPSATPTADVTPWPLDKPFPAALSEDLAAAAAIRWFDPAREPRVEWTTVVRREDLAQAWGSEPLVNAAEPGRKVLTVGALPPAMVGVLISTNGMSLQDGQERPALLNPCYGAPHGSREQAFYAFDATSGSVVLSELVYAELAPAVAALAALPRLQTAASETAIAVVPTPVPLPSATPGPAAPPWPTVPPAAPTLAPDSVPPALVDTLRAWPLFPGNSWTWRVTSREEGVRWLVAVVTETVESGWLLDDQTAAIRTRIEVQPVTDRAPDGLSPGTTMRYVAPRGVFPTITMGTDAKTLARLGILDQNGKPGSTLPLEPVHTPLDAGHGAAMPSSVEEGTTDVEVVAGGQTYSGCTRYAIRGGMGWGTIRWVCPGVGHVRAEMHTCTAFVGVLTVYDLVASSRTAAVP